MMSNRAEAKQKGALTHAEVEIWECIESNGLVVAMAKVFQRLTGLYRWPERIFIHSRWSSGLCQSGQLAPVKRCEAHLGANYASPEFTASVGSYLLVSRPLIDQRAPPILPFGHQRSIDLPNVSTLVSLDMPTVKSLLDKIHITPDHLKIEAPQQGQVVEKKAHRMIVIRKRKMRKHQLRKFRKKFRVLIMTRRKKRNILKKTVFFTDVMNKLLVAEAFDAEAYVKDKLKRAYDPLPVKPELPRPMPWEFQPIFAMSKKKN